MAENNQPHTVESFLLLTAANQVNATAQQNGINARLINSLSLLVAEVQALTIKLEALEAWAIAHGGDPSELEELAERIRQDREWAQEADGQPEPGAEQE